MISPKFIEKLRELTGAAALRTEADDLKIFDSDWTKLPGHAELAVLPASTSEVSKILALCSREKISVVPSGGRTGLAGGAVVKPGQLAISLSRMTKLDPVENLGRTIRAQSGATTHAVHEAAHPLGLTWPIDLASKGSCTIGGNLATNAGGVRVIRYGMTRKWVTAIQAVLMSGEVIEINKGLEKNNTGFDLLQLLIGSEGTLAVITEATLKLAPLPQASIVFFFAARSLGALNHLLQAAWNGPFTINAFEFLSGKCFDLVQSSLNRGKGFPAGSPFYVLMEVEPHTHGTSDALSEWMENLIEKKIIIDGTLATEPRPKAELWSIREGITESISTLGEVVKYDVAVPVAKLQEFLESTERLFAERTRCFELFLFGHFGDGSPHLNLSKSRNCSQDAFHADVALFEKELFPLLKHFDGSASSEHGVGIAKKHWVDYSRTPTELQLFRSIKRAFDPEGLMNPGKIFNVERFNT